MVVSGVYEARYDVASAEVVTSTTRVLPTTGRERSCGNRVAGPLGTSATILSRHQMTLWTQLRIQEPAPSHNPAIPAPETHGQSLGRGMWAHAPVETLR